MNFDDALSLIHELHQEKSQQYGANEDEFYNLHNAEPVIAGVLKPLEYCLTLPAKHDTAMWLLIAARLSDRHYHSPSSPDSEYQKRGGAYKLRECLVDGIVYRLMALCLLNEEEGKTDANPR